MAERRHFYLVQLKWEGHDKPKSQGFKRQNRSYLLSAAGKPAIVGSSDALFRGDAHRWNPEELLLASLCACHQLWYLGLCAEAGVTVTAYEDEAEGVMIENDAGGAGQFTDVLLRPHVTLAPGADVTLAEALHHEAHAKCFIARSVNFPVRHAARAVVATPLSQIARTL
jgi:organic hydroperoxide reductase OsmC/OhrA